MNRYFFFIAALIYMVSAYFNSGYFHPDEHYQIIEFAEYLSGNTPASDLPWEFPAGLRPAIQPALCYGILILVRTLGLHDPYYITFLFRIITGCFALITIYHFQKSQNVKIGGAVLFVLLLWFLPFINIRFTSETWSGLFFINALTVLFGRIKHRYFYVGLLLGFSFLFRYQTAFMTLGLLFWLVIIEKTRFSDLMALIAGGVLIFLTGIAIDCWFYQKFVITSYNYLYINVIKGTASDFGVSPWYFFFVQILKPVILPTGISILLSYLLILRYDPRNIILWIITPFILIHCLIPHKELRFLFPVANLLPLMILKAADLLKAKLKIAPKINFAALALFTVYNVVALAYMTFSPADNGNARLSQFIHRQYKNTGVNLYTAHELTNPYQPWSPLKQGFYRDANVRIISFQNAGAIDTSGIESAPNLLVIRKSDVYYSAFRELFMERDMKLIQSSYPNWQDKLNQWIFPERSNDNILLFLVGKK